MRFQKYTLSYTTTLINLSEDKGIVYSETS
jgi:hypothetical protein